MLTESSSGAIDVSLGRQQHLHEGRGEAWHCTGGLPIAWPCSRHPASRASRQPATVLRLSAIQLVDCPCPAEKWSGRRLGQILCIHTQVRKSSAGRKCLRLLALRDLKNMLVLIAMGGHLLISFGQPGLDC